MRFLEQRQFRIRLLPQRQKVLVRSPRSRLVAAHRLGAGQLQLRQRRQRKILRNAPVRQDFLELGGGFLSPLRS
jgi:hypothetical protein